MAGLKFGIKEVANVIFSDIVTGEIQIIFDTLKVSSIENNADTVDATGGRGGGKLLTWEQNRTATVSLTDALISMQSLALLAGDKVITEGIELQRKKVVKGSEIATLKEKTGFLAYERVDGNLGEKLADVESPVPDKEYLVFFREVAEEGEKAEKVVFSSEKYGGYYRVTMDALVRDQKGNDQPMQVVFPKAKLQSGFTFTLDVENVSTFDFNMEANKDENNELYYVVKYETLDGVIQ